MHTGLGDHIDGYVQESGGVRQKTRQSVQVSTFVITERFYTKLVLI
jgi:hypothetical protein